MNILFPTAPREEQVETRRRIGPKNRSRLYEGGHELFKPSMLVGFDGSDRDTELLPARPAHSRPIDEYRRMLPWKKDTQSDHRAWFNWLRPIDTPSVEREIPRNARSLDLIARIIDRTLNGETTKRPHLKRGTHGCA
ncbi:MAG: hypothetical protein K0S58_1095 [Nitrospira sp.]|nr:hypothetical protein [Nitrospira sp.]